MYLGSTKERHVVTESSKGVESSVTLETIWGLVEIGERTCKTKSAIYGSLHTKLFTPDHWESSQTFKPFVTTLHYHCLLNDIWLRGDSSLESLKNLEEVVLSFGTTPPFNTEV